MNLRTSPASPAHQQIRPAALTAHLTQLCELMGEESDEASSVEQGSPVPHRALTDENPTHTGFPHFPCEVDAIFQTENQLD